MFTYVGKRTEDSCTILVNGKKLNPKFDLWDHSPDGFEWGYGGSGPSQTSLALLYHYFSHNGSTRKEAGDKAVRLHQSFKSKVVSNFPHEQWYLTTETIETVLEELEKLEV